MAVRYALRTDDGRPVRRAKLNVDVEPNSVSVQLPERPTPLPGLVVRWGRLDDPPDKLSAATNPPDVPRHLAPPAPGNARE